MLSRARFAVSGLIRRQPGRLASIRLSQPVLSMTRASSTVKDFEAPSLEHMPSAIARRLVEQDDTTCVMNLFRLDGKVIPITGGARGIGLETAIGCIEAGAKHVYSLDKLSEPSPEFFEARKRLANTYTGQLHYVQVDATNASDVNKVIGAIAERHDGIHGCIAAAGINYIRNFLEYPAEEISRLMGVNYNGVFHVAQACGRQMEKYGKQGSIVLIASMSGTIANRGLHCSVYNSSKAAVVQLARNMAMELGPNIRTNSLSPGNVLTPMVKKNFADQPELREKWENGNMLGRIANAEEFKGPAVFLLSDASSFMTGGDLRVDGGYTAW